jgi:hypothetical protein
MVDDRLTPNKAVCLYCSTTVDTGYLQEAAEPKLYQLGTDKLHTHSSASYHFAVQELLPL